MAQPSVANYFCNRKRTAIEDIKLTRARKILVQVEKDEQDNPLDATAILNSKVKAALIEGTKIEEKPVDPILLENNLNGKVVEEKNAKNKGEKVAKAKAPPKQTRRKIKDPNQKNLQEIFNKMNQVTEIDKIADPEELHKTPPASPIKRTNAMDKIKVTRRELNFNEIKQRLSRSSRLNELKASIAKFNETSKKLDEIEKKSAETPDSPSLKTFKSIELEVTLSPQKVQQPEKAYLSPKKDTTARRNLLNALSPTKNAISIPSSPTKQLFSPQKPSLALPLKYRTLAEMFRSIDTVCQIMHNRKETITFHKLKPAVEELLKRNLYEKTLGQIKNLFPNAYTFKQEKIRGYGVKIMQWELVIEPILTKDSMTPECLLERRRNFYNILIERTKKFHQEFLLSLEPPLVIPSSKITRWHPEFDIEKVPDIESSPLPQSPDTEKLTTGKEVLEKARKMFNCNTKMEQALLRLKEAQEKNPEVVPEVPKITNPALKGIPQALLEKVRQRQAAKAFESMTRSEEKEKEIQLYSKLPEIARLARNLFVSEKKGVLPLELVLQKLGDSMRSYMSKSDLEKHLRILEKEVPGWIVFHTVRNTLFVRLSKNGDLSLVIDKLERMIKVKKGV